MSYPNVPPTRSPRIRTTLGDWGLAYKVALGVVAIGAFLIVLSPMVGGILHTLAITPLLELLGAPEGRKLLPIDEPRTSVELLAVLGSCNIVVGISIFCVRLVLELLGLAGAPTVTCRMRPPGKLALGTAATGLVVFASGVFPRILVSLLFIDHEAEVQGITSALGEIAKAGVLLMVCSLITPLLRGHGSIRRILFGWADTVGWGKLGYGWINRLSVAFVVVGTIGSFLFLGDVASIFFGTGFIVLIIGVFPHLLADGGP